MNMATTMTTTVGEAHPLIIDIGNSTELVNLTNANPSATRDIAALVEAIKGVRSLKCWALLGEQFLEKLSDSELQAILEALMACPTLAMLKCSDLKDRSFLALHAAFLKDTITSGVASRLADISIVGQTRSETIMPSFVEQLARIPTLESVSLMLLAPDNQDVQSSITAGFCGASQNSSWIMGVYDDYIPLLQTVFHLNQHLPQQAFTNLKVSGIDASGIASQTIAEILQHSALDKLQISFDLMHPDGAVNIADALAYNNTTLKELSISIEIDHAQSFKIERLAEMLQTNRTLEWLELSRSLWDNRCALAFANALKHNNNQTLKVLDVNFDMPGQQVTITDSGYKALLEMLKQTNHKLEIVPLPDNNNDDRLKSRMEWYLQLNESGLRQVQLSVNTCVDQFLRLLEEHGDDLNYFFYLLLKNPSLFSAERRSV